MASYFQALSEQLPTRQSLGSHLHAVNERLPSGTNYVVAGAVVGAAAIPLAGMAAGATVPWAMSAFGTVVPGVGTMHAAGGVAATLQWASTAFTGGVAWYGAAAGAGAAAAATTATGSAGGESDDATAQTGCKCQRKCCKRHADGEEATQDGGEAECDDTHGAARCKRVEVALGDVE
ncbi:hypothetical protein Gpo141_00007532 [Globisporangium polare]